MVQSQKYRQRWEFKRRDDNHFNSSSNGHEASSSGMPVIKKHKIVPNLILHKIDETGDISKFQRKGRYTYRMGGGRFRVEKSNKKNIGSSGMEDASYREDNRKKSNNNAHVPTPMDSIRIVMESILEELKVARENMFKWMREEMHKMMSDNSTPVPTPRFDTSLNVQNSNGGPLLGSIKRERAVNSCTSYEVLGNQAVHCGTISSTTSMETEREMLGSSVEGSLPFSISPSGHFGSSMYLTLPMILPEICVENQRFDSTSCDYFLTREDDNQMDSNIGKANPTLSSSIHTRSFQGDQKEDEVGNVNNIGSQGLGYIGQNKLALASSFGSGFPVPLSRNLDCCYKIQAQARVENPSQVHENIFGTNVNGGMRSLREGHGLSELNNVSNNLRDHVSSKAKDYAWTQGNLVPSSQKVLHMHELLYQE